MSFLICGMGDIANESNDSAIIQFKTISIRPSVNQIPSAISL